MPTEQQTVKIMMKAKELTDADVEYISLVSRPANRIPFRVTKSEEAKPLIEEKKSMFDFGKILKKDGDEATKSSIAAVVIRKADAEKMADVLTTHGFDLTQPLEVEENIVYKQKADFDEDKTLAYKASDDILVLIEGPAKDAVQKAFAGYSEGISFDDKVKADGFVPGVLTASEVLVGTMGNIMRASEDQGQMRSAMKQALNEYVNYVMTLTDQLPSVAFKMEDVDMATDKVVEKAEAEKAEEKMEDKQCPAGMTYDKASGKCVEMKESAKDEESGEDAGASDTGAIEAEADAAASDTGESSADEAGNIEPVSKESDSQNEEVIQKKETADEAQAEGQDESVAKGESDEPPAWAKGLIEKVDSIQKSVDDVVTTQKGLDDRMDEVEKVAKSADEAAKGTVLSGSDEIENQSLGIRTKSDTADDLWAGVLDNVVPTGSQ